MPVGVTFRKVSQLILFSAALFMTAHGQTTARATIGLSARLPSSATLPQTLHPISIVVNHGSPAQTEFPIDLKWNIDPREATSVRIVATLVGSSLTNPSHDHPSKVAAGDLLAGIAGNDLRPFNGATSSLVLMNVSVSAANRQGTQESNVQLKIDDGALSNLPDGVYFGWIRLDAQIL